MSAFSDQQRAAESAALPVERGRSAWRCVKCDHHDAEMGESRQAGSGLAALFEVEGLRFTTLSCRRCGYTEFYKGDSSVLGALFDLAVG
jgi:predicted nucleic-acid-binding Zn-ribbon protein